MYILGVKSFFLHLYAFFNTDSSASISRVLSDGAWHKVTWEVQGQSIVVEVNGSVSRIDGGINMHPANRNNSILLYLGARPYAPGEVTGILLLDISAVYIIIFKWKEDKGFFAQFFQLEG